MYNTRVFKLDISLPLYYVYVFFLRTSFSLFIIIILLFVTTRHLFQGAGVRTN